MLEMIFPTGFDPMDKDAFSVSVLFDTKKDALKPFQVVVRGENRLVGVTPCATLSEAVEERGYHVQALTEWKLDPKRAAAQ